MRAVRSGVLRCCSQSCTASMAKPNRRENSDCEHFSFFLNALTSKSSGTCTTKPSLISPRAKARASLAAFVSLVPILDMTLHSLPELPNDIPQNALQLVPFRFAQVRFLSLGIYGQQKYRHIFAGIECDHTIATALFLYRDP